MEKPYSGFFHYVWDKIGEYESNEVLIIGDSLTSDMQGGNNAGILCCWYNPTGKENNTGLRIDYEINDLQKILDIIDL